MAAAAVDVINNTTRAAVSIGGTTAPSSGTVEDWTVVEATPFPAIGTGGTQQFRVIDLDDLNKTVPNNGSNNGFEIMLVTSRNSSINWGDVARGAEGTTPWAHAPNWTAVLVPTGAALNNAFDPLGAAATALAAAVLLAGSTMTGPLRTPYLGIGAGIGSAINPFFQNSLINGSEIVETGAATGADYIISVIDGGAVGGFANLIHTPTGSMTGNEVTLTAGTVPTGFAVGWTVLMPGAGPAAATLKTTVASLIDSTHFHTIASATAPVTGQTITISLVSDPDFWWLGDDFAYTGSTAGDIAGLTNIFSRLTEMHMETPDADLLLLAAGNDVVGIEATGGGTVAQMFARVINLPYNFGSATGTTAGGLYIGLGAGGVTAVPGYTNTYGLEVGQGLSTLLSGPTKIQQGSAGAVALTVQAYLDPTANLVELYDVTGTFRVALIAPGGGFASEQGFTAYQGDTFQTNIGDRGGLAGIAFGTAETDTIVRTSAGLLTASSIFSAATAFLSPSQSADVAAPASGNAEHYATTVAGRERLKQRSSVFAPTPIGDTLWAKTWILGRVNGNSLAWDGNGGGSSTGTITYVGATTSYPTMLNFAGLGSAGNIADAATSGGGGMQVFRGASADVYSGWIFKAKVLFPDSSYNNTGASTGSRVVVGVVSGVGTAFGADHAGATSGVSFCRSNVNGGAIDTDFQIVTNNGGTATVADTGMALTSNHVYVMTINCPAGSTTVYWQIDDLTASTSVSGSVTATLPAASTALFGTLGVSTVDATVRNIQMAYLSLETDQG